MAQNISRQTLEEVYAKIKSLMTQKRWKDAHRACLEVLQWDPENIKVIRWKNKIEEAVKRINKEALRKDIENLKELWKEKKYNELMINIKKLEPYVDAYPPLKDFIIKAKKEYRDILIAGEEEDYQEGLRRIKEFKGSGDYALAYKVAEQLRKLDIRKEEVKKLVKEISEEWVDYELNQNKKLLQSKSYEEIILFYQRLLRINDRSEKVRKLLEKAKEEYDLYKIDQKRDFFYKELENLRTLYQLNKFDEALDIARALLDIDPRNKIVRELYLKAEKKAKGQVEKQLSKQMEKSMDIMKEEYKEDKSKYIKL
jgi:tetratricopeptide (TPR) repeat protein